MIENFWLNKKIFFLFQTVVEKVDTDWFFVFLADYLLYFIYILFIFYFYKRIWEDKKIQFQEFLVYFSATFVAWFFTKIFKLLFHTERPFSFFPIETLEKHTDVFQSFPSGHATLAFAMAFSVYFYNKKIGFWLIFSALLVAMGRVFIGVHFPLDVLVGGLWGFLSVFFVNRMLEKKAYKN